MARDNRVWGNSVGMSGYNAPSTGNRVYGNTVGIRDDGYGRVFNNLVYDNTSVGIHVDYAHNAGADGVVNNTVHQVGGRAVEVTSGNVVLRNNIIWSQGGTALWVDSDSQGGFASDYNLFYLTDGASLAWWEDRLFADRTDWYFETGFDRNSLTGDPQFIDINGGDGINGWDGSFPGPSQVIDDEDAGQVFTGSWTENGTKGYAGDFWQAPAGAGSATSRWTFSGLQEGFYRIAVTWPREGPSASNARYTVFDGTGTVLAYQSLNHHYSTPDDLNVDGAVWEILGDARLEGGTLVVELSDFANGKVLADAVRIERYSGDFGADDDYHLQAGLAGAGPGQPERPTGWNEPLPNGGAPRPGCVREHGAATPSAGSDDPGAGPQRAGEIRGRAELPDRLARGGPGKHRPGAVAQRGQCGAGGQLPGQQLPEHDVQPKYDQCQPGAGPYGRGRCGPGGGVPQLCHGPVGGGQEDCVDAAGAGRRVPGAAALCRAQQRQCGPAPV